MSPCGFYGAFPSAFLYFPPLLRGKSASLVPFCALSFLDSSSRQLAKAKKPGNSGEPENPIDIVRPSPFVRLPLGVKSIEYLKRQHCHIFKLSVQVLSPNFCVCLRREGGDNTFVSFNKHLYDFGLSAEWPRGGDSGMRGGVRAKQINYVASI